MSNFLLCFALSLASFLISAVILRNGVGAGPDPWSYWEGSVGLIEKHSYCYLSGSPLFFWPPLFSLFLALFQWPLPQTGRTLALAMSVCSGLSAFAWSLYVLKIFPGENGSRKSPACVISLLFVPLFVPLCSLSLSSNSLVLFFVGLLFYRLARLGETRAFWPAYKGPAVLGLLLCGCMLTHNSSVVFVVATVIAVLLAAGGSVRQRVLGSGLILLISLIPWMGIRHWLGQEGSHEMTGGAYTVFQSVEQALYGVGVFFISTASALIQGLVGVLILAGLFVVLARRPRSETETRCRLLMGLSLLVLAGFFLLLNLIPIGDKLGGRFFYFFPLAITPPLLFRTKKQLTALAALTLLTVGVSGARISQRVWHGESAPLDKGVKEQSARVIYSEYFLTSKKDPVAPLGTVRVNPPVFPWKKKHWTDQDSIQMVELIDSETNIVH